LTTTNGGSTFYGGNNDRVAGETYSLGGWLSTTELPGRNQIEAAPDEVTHDRIEWRLGREWLSSHRSLLPKLLACKFLRLWLPDVDSKNKKYVFMQMVTYGPFLMLFALG